MKTGFRAVGPFHDGPYKGAWILFNADPEDGDVSTGSLRRGKVPMLFGAGTDGEPRTAGRLIGFESRKLHREFGSTHLPQAGCFSSRQQNQSAQDGVSAGTVSLRSNGD